MFSWGYSEKDWSTPVQLKKTLAQVQPPKPGGQVQESGPEGAQSQEPPESAVAPGTEGLGSE